MSLIVWRNLSLKMEWNLRNGRGRNSMVIHVSLFYTAANSLTITDSECYRKYKNVKIFSEGVETA